MDRIQMASGALRTHNPFMSVNFLTRFTLPLTLPVVA